MITCQFVSIRIILFHEPILEIVYVGLKGVKILIKSWQYHFHIGPTQTLSNMDHKSLFDSRDMIKPLPKKKCMDFGIFYSHNLIYTWSFV